MSGLPVLFLSHGSPMHALLPSAATQVWAELAQALPRPRAVLIASAHWETAQPLLGAAGSLPTIHDFGGFPDALYRIQYPARGEPALAGQALALLRSAGFMAQLDSTRGLDHGAWVPLSKMYPQADLPVLSLSIQPARDAAHHHALGRALAPLREQGVLIIASGHMTHNLRDMQPGNPAPTPYAQAFRDWVATRLQAGDAAALQDWEKLAPHARQAHPTPEHFLPLLVALGAAAGDPARCVHAGFEFGALAMDAWCFGEA